MENTTLLSQELSPRSASLFRGVKKKISKSQYNDLRNGILYLKGGDLTNELFTFLHKVKTWDISEWFEEEFFETIKVIFLLLNG